MAQMGVLKSAGGRVLALQGYLYSFDDVKSFSTTSLWAVFLERICDNLTSSCCCCNGPISGRIADPNDPGTWRAGTEILSSHRSIHREEPEALRLPHVPLGRRVEVGQAVLVHVPPRKALELVAVDLSAMRVQVLEAPRHHKVVNAFASW